MSWLLNSIANSLTLDDDDDDAEEEVTAAASATSAATGAGHDQPPSPRQGGGVKEDLSELSETLARKFRSVAFFLAPPPSISDRETETSSQPSDQKELDHIAGIRSDLTEIGGRFRAGISNLSSHKAVAEFTKIASNLLQLGAEEDETVSFEEYAERGVVGVSQEVVAFARNVAMHPETWLDFPLNDDDEQDEFDMSDAQQEHALAVEQLAPRLAALRIELCPGYMSEGCFWKIYFVLLHPRLSKHVADILSTPEIVKTRSMLTQEIHSRARSKDLKVGKPGGENAPVENANSSHEVHLSVPSNDQSESVPVEISTVDVSPTPSVEVDKHTVTSTEIPVIDKEVVEEVHQTLHEKPTAGTSKAVDQHEEDDTDDWLKEETLEVGGASRNSVPVGNDDDVSFSDLEDDDDDVK